MKARVGTSDEESFSDDDYYDEELVAECLGSPEVVAVGLAQWRGLKLYRFVRSDLEKSEAYRRLVANPTILEKSCLQQMWKGLHRPGLVCPA